MSKTSPIPRSIWALGFVSLLMDISSEMVHSLLPLFLTGVLGASAVWVGLIEGVGEATAMLVKVFSGPLSDYLGKRKPLAVFGYTLGALSKPLFALAPTVGWVMGARVTDRIGKGIRGAPRDALIADLTDHTNRGAAYGLRQSLDTIGALLGPLLAVWLMVLLHDEYRKVFWMAAVPGLLAASLLILAVREPAAEVKSSAQARVNPLQFDALRSFPKAFWWVVGIGGVFSLCRFSEAFLVLRAQQTGLELAYAPMVIVVMSLVYSVSAFPLGKLSDKMDARWLLMIGVVVLVCADLTLGAFHSVYSVMAGVALWGLHMGFTQGVLSALVARNSPKHLRGTAFGLFNLISGLTILGASLLAGVLWEDFGSAYTFYTGAGLGILVLILITFARV
ncbi:MFS transporter [Limnobacter litoralis]|uniref:MFS transporter n=1 Tax=Limnobacter litoralis TaxID=481366 RepID=A0ABQ5YTY0_9BURK|nr:MFS transporter [Limnobacter litoralis]GLR26353.1 MFS transporter [Limnobacter litoralis]